MRRFAHRFLRGFGLHVERHRDLFADLRKLVPNVRCAIDGGAYHGKASRNLLRVFPDVQVHAFEPQPELIAWLEPVAQGNPRWHLHRIALADTNGEVPFYVAKGQIGRGSILDQGAEGSRTTTFPVPATTLATWAQQRGVVPEFLKLALEGAELKALKGAIPLLPAVRAIATKVHFPPRNAGHTSFGDVTEFLEQNGYYLHRLYEIQANRSGQWAFADALFVRRHEARR